MLSTLQLPEPNIDPRLNAPALLDTRRVIRNEIGPMYRDRLTLLFKDKVDAAPE